MRSIFRLLALLFAFQAMGVPAFSAPRHSAVKARNRYGTSVKTGMSAIRSDFNERRVSYNADINVQVAYAKRKITFAQYVTYKRIRQGGGKPRLERLHGRLTNCWVGVIDPVRGVYSWNEYRANDGGKFDADVEECWALIYEDAETIAAGIPPVVLRTTCNNVILGVPPPEVPAKAETPPPPVRLTLPIEKRAHILNWLGQIQKVEDDYPYPCFHIGIYGEIGESGSDDWERVKFLDFKTPGIVQATGLKKRRYKIVEEDVPAGWRIFEPEGGEYIIDLCKEAPRKLVFINHFVQPRPLQPKLYEVPVEKLPRFFRGRGANRQEVDQPPDFLTPIFQVLVYEEQGESGSENWSEIRTLNFHGAASHKVTGLKARRYRFKEIQLPGWTCVEPAGGECILDLSQEAPRKLVFVNEYVLPPLVQAPPPVERKIRKVVVGFQPEGEHSYEIERTPSTETTIEEVGSAGVVIADTNRVRVTRRSKSHHIKIPAVNIPPSGNKGERQPPHPSDGHTRP